MPNSPNLRESFHKSGRNWLGGLELRSGVAAPVNTSGVNGLCRLVFGGQVMFKRALKRTWRKLCFVKKRNDLFVSKAHRANLDRVRLAVRVMVPTHLGIIFLLARLGSAWAVNRLIFVHTTLFLLEVLLWLAVSPHKSRHFSLAGTKLITCSVLLLIVCAGICVTFLEQLLVRGVMPFLITNVLLGTFFIIRPRVAIPFFTAVYLLFGLAAQFAGLSSQALTVSRLHGLFAAGMGLSLSLITWRNFYLASLQKEKIKEQKDLLEQMAYHDPLTDLPNRRFLDEIVKKDLALAKRSGHRSCLLVLDIDDFKNVNDSYGHPVGDLVLRKLAFLLKTNIRDTDTVARVGGEEFVILLANTGLKEGLQVAEELRLLIQEHIFQVEEFLVKLTVSLGVALLTPDETGLSYYEQADRALYRAKALGKNRVKIIEAS